MFKARLAFLSLSAALLMGFFAYSQKIRTYPELSASLLVMNGVEVQIKGYGCRSKDFEAALQDIKARYRKLESLMSRFLPESEIFRINRAQGFVQVDKGTFELLEISKQLYRESRGAFDIACLPLLQLWKEAAKAGKLPLESAILKARTAGSVETVQLDPVHLQVQIAPGMGLDLGGIAQGYFADQGVEILKNHGISRGLVNCSGEIAVFDDRERPEAFSIGIFDPVTFQSDGKVSMLKGAVSTSGNYARYFEVNGRKYSHIVDPVTGWPASQTASVTVQGPTAVEADAWSTACAVIAARGEDPYAALPSGFRILALVKDAADSKNPQQP